MSTTTPHRVQLSRRKGMAEAGEHGQRGTPVAVRNLACWCRIGLRCHADVLLEIANGPEEDR